MKARWDHENTRSIRKRIVVTGDLKLNSPAHFGNGEVDELTDMPLIRDPKDGLPLLTGASIAGAARSYLREVTLGYFQPEPQDGASIVETLFGAVLKDKKESREGYLVIDDAIATNYGIENRPGVAIDPVLRTAIPEKLYDTELLEAGTTFPLRFELSLPDDPLVNEKLRAGLALILLGFQSREIAIGARKRRGFGECMVDSWEVETYDLSESDGLLAWIEGRGGRREPDKTLLQRLDLEQDPRSRDMRKLFSIDSTFTLDSSLLIRSGSGQADSPDMIHLKSRRGGKTVPILSGTSLGGALRARALRIAQTVNPNKAEKLIEDLFGPKDIEPQFRRQPPWASRVTVFEREVKGGYERVQSRLRIDRFTGGAYPGALFEQQPYFGKADTHVKIEVELRDPEEAHIGLLLHLLKDLWTSDLPLGGEASVGRGRLKGLSAKLVLKNPGAADETWTIEAKENGRVTITGKTDLLNQYAQSVEAYHGA